MNFVESERINRLHSRMLTDKVCCYFKLNPYVVALAQAKSPIKGSPKLFSQIVMSVFTPFLLRSFTTHSSNSVCNENMQFDYGLLLSYLRIEVMFKKMLINKTLATFQTIKTKYYLSFESCGTKAQKSSDLAASKCFFLGPRLPFIADLTLR